MGRRWTSEEEAIVRNLYHVETAPAIAARLKRTALAVRQYALSLGLASPKNVVDAAAKASIRHLNGLGYSDTEIARTLGYERKTIHLHRKAMGLPSQARGERYRARVRAGTRRQCAAAGVRNLAQVRSLVFQRRASEAGWPADLPFRSVQILDALSERGPLTRREIAEAIGMPWVSSRRSFKGGHRTRGGSYLAELIARGMVVSLGRIASGEGSGHSSQVYSLTLDCERGTFHDADTRA